MLKTIKNLIYNLISKESNVSSMRFAFLVIILNTLLMSWVALCMYGYLEAIAVLTDGVLIATGLKLGQNIQENAKTK